ncbi:unannotated protein [freshwater metagenome]|uniref:Unannotated protein n=1 Tax=freshwater metagenome TaxID=449393 RepID=A0A6J7F2J7_9ZZZZ
MLDRRQRSRLRNYSEQIGALGLRRWIVFKGKRLRSRFSASGTRFSVSTPLAQFPVTLRAQTSDTNVFSQIFLHREYRCLDEVVSPRLIIDCGANVGCSAAYLLSRFPGSRLIAIEPDSGNFETLQHNLAPYGDRCTMLQSGVWSSSVPLVVSSTPANSNREWSVTVRAAAAGEQGSIMAVDIGTLLRDSGEERISILKIDIEGSEAEVFAANVEPWLSRVDNLVIELHGAKCRSVFMAAIDGLGFEISECEELTVCTRPA